MYLDFKAVNPTTSPLDTVIDDLVPEICLDLKLLYMKLPKMICIKVPALSTRRLRVLDAQKALHYSNIVCSPKS